MIYVAILILIAISAVPVIALASVLIRFTAIESVTNACYGARRNFACPLKEKA